MILGIQLTDLLRALSSGLQTPVIVILLLLAAVTIIMIGTLIAELFTERIGYKVNLPRLVDEIRSRDLKVTEIIKHSGLLKLQRRILLEIASHPELTANMREALARKLLYQEQARYNCITKITDLIARLGPILGLLGTLIPLGPGLIALGQGDTYTLSRSLLTAFDTTIAGLSVAAVSYVISTIRKSWYERSMATTEAIAACLLERESGFQ